jgi:hypothetical protein
MNWPDILGRRSIILSFRPSLQLARVPQVNGRSPHAIAEWGPSNSSPFETSFSLSRCRI